MHSFLFTSQVLKKSYTLCKDKKVANEKKLHISNKENLFKLFLLVLQLIQIAFELILICLFDFVVEIFCAIF